MVDGVDGNSRSRAPRGRPARRAADTCLWPWATVGRTAFADFGRNPFVVVPAIGGEAARTMGNPFPPSVREKEGQALNRSNPRDAQLLTFPCYRASENSMPTRGKLAAGVERWDARKAPSPAIGRDVDFDEGPKGGRRRIPGRTAIMDNPQPNYVPPRNGGAKSSGLSSILQAALACQ